MQGKSLMDSFIDWNKKVMREDRPVAGFNYTNDGKGNKSLQVAVGNSRFWWYEKENKIESKPETIEDAIDFDDIKFLE